MGGDASYYYDDFWEYEPALNVWTQKADFEGADVNYPVGFSIGTVGYLGTGTTVGGATDDFWEYNPVPCSGGLRLINPTLTLENKTHEYQSAKIYPNPASNEAILSFPIGENQKGSLELYSTMGQKIIMYELKPLETLRIDLSGIQTGVYFYTIRVNGEIINSDKLIVIK
jgi:hypothetical protein